MKKIFYYTALLSLLACAEKKSDADTGAKETAVENKATDSKTVPIDTGTKTKTENATATLLPANYVESFEAFRTAVTAKDKVQTKTFLNLPYTEEATANALWYLVDPNLEGESISKFTEADLDKHFDKLFNENFKTGLQKINTKELLSKKAFKTPFLQGKGFTYTFNAKLNGPDQFIIEVHEIYKGEAAGESIMSYFFDVKNNEIKLANIGTEGS